DDAVAGDDDGDGVLAVGQSHGADCLGSADAFGDVFVADGYAIGDFRQRLPDALLKGSALGARWQIEVAQFAGEISPQLFNGGAKNLRIFLSLGRNFFEVDFRIHVQAGELFAIADQQ